MFLRLDDGLSNYEFRCLASPRLYLASHQRCDRVVLGDSSCLAVQTPATKCYLGNLWEGLSAGLEGLLHALGGGVVGFEVEGVAYAGGGAG